MKEAQEREQRVMFFIPVDGSSLNPVTITCVGFCVLWNLGMFSFHWTIPRFTTFIFILIVIFLHELTGHFDGVKFIVMSFSFLLKRFAPFSLFGGEKGQIFFVATRL